MKDIIFIIDSEAAFDRVNDVRIICEEAIEYAHRRAEPAPVKFVLGKQAADNILSVQAVSITQFRALLDVIGGFYLAAEAFETMYGSKSPKDAAQFVSDAKALMHFAMALAKQAEGVWPDLNKAKI